MTLLVVLFTMFEANLLKNLSQALPGPERLQQFFQTTTKSIEP